MGTRSSKPQRTSDCLRSTPSLGRARPKSRGGRCSLRSSPPVSWPNRPASIAAGRTADCGAVERLDLPLRYWPALRSGTPDLVIDRQLGQRGQCQHFMADSADSLTPVDPRFGVPGGLATTAYLRCIRVAGLVFDGILRDPRLAEWRIVGMYVLMHALEDSFSAAHVARDPQFRIVHLLSWTLIDWPIYTLHGKVSFPAATHHALSDHRDADYVRWDARTQDGRACRELHHPYAFPEECLTERAKAAAGAVVDYLVLTYRLRARALAEGRQASLFLPAPAGDAALWMAFVKEDLPSVAVAPELPGGPQSALPRPDVFVGAQGIVGAHLLGVGLWGARLFMGPASPFLLGLTGGAGFSRQDGVGQLGAFTQLGLLLPLVRRFAIGVAPAGVQLVCSTHLESCRADAVATLGQLLIPLGSTAWLGVEGPRWSWTERTVGPTWVGLALGWAHEDLPRFEPPGPDAAATWDPARARRGQVLSPHPLEPRRLPGDDRGVGPQQWVRRSRTRVALGSRSLGSARWLCPRAAGRARRREDRQCRSGKQPGRRSNVAALPASQSARGDRDTGVDSGRRVCRSRGGLRRRGSRRHCAGAGPARARRRYTSPVVRLPGAVACAADHHPARAAHRLTVDGDGARVERRVP